MMMRHNARPGASMRPLCRTFLAATFLMLAACSGTQAAPLRLATTTSTYDSGLLDAILPKFEAQTGIRVEVIAVGTGQALALGERGDADLLWVHHPALEEQFIRQGHGAARVPIMRNDFILVGPCEDPAGARGLARAAEAFRRIAQAATPFASRGDESGTHARERELWTQAGEEPDPDASWYFSLGQGMGETLQFAQERAAYTLSDRGTFLALQSSLPELCILVGGATMAENADEALYNEYSLIPVDPDRHPGVNTEGADAFLAWARSPETLQAIGEYGLAEFGQPLFLPIPEAED